MWNKLTGKFALLGKLWALRGAVAKANPQIKAELAVWERVGKHFWGQVRLKADDADGLTLAEMVELLTNFLEHDLPELIGPPRPPEQAGPSLGSGQGGAHA